MLNDRLVYLLEKMAAYFKIEEHHVPSNMSRTFQSKKSSNKGKKPAICCGKRGLLIKMRTMRIGGKLFNWVKDFSIEELNVSVGSEFVRNEASFRCPGLQDNRFTKRFISLSII